MATLEDAESEALVEDIEDAAGDVSDEEALLAFAQCMRDNGVENFEDPVVDADGELRVIDRDSFAPRYRDGGLGDAIVVQATFELAADDPTRARFAQVRPG